MGTLDEGGEKEHRETQKKDGEKDEKVQAPTSPAGRKGANSTRADRRVWSKEKDREKKVFSYQKEKATRA